MKKLILESIHNQLLEKQTILLKKLIEKLSGKPLHIIRDVSWYKLDMWILIETIIIVPHTKELEIVVRYKFIGGLVASLESDSVWKLDIREKADLIEIEEVIKFFIKEKIEYYLSIKGITVIPDLIH